MEEEDYEYDELNMHEQYLDTCPTCGDTFLWPRDCACDANLVAMLINAKANVHVRYEGKTALMMVTNSKSQMGKCCRFCKRN